MVLCMGIEVKQPQIEFDTDMLIIKIGTKNSPLNINNFCNDPWQSMQATHPDFLLNNTKIMKELQEKLDKFKGYEPYLYLDQVQKSYWKSLDLKYISPSIHVLSSHNAYK